MYVVNISCGRCYSTWDRRTRFEKRWYCAKGVLVDICSPDSSKRRSEGEWGMSSLDQRRGMCATTLSLLLVPLLLISSGAVAGVILAAVVLWGTGRCRCCVFSSRR